MLHNRSISTWQSILDAAIPEFLEHGYRGASVRSIASRAGASANAITYHFGGKEALYREVLSTFATLQSEQVKSILSGIPETQEEFTLRLEIFLERLLDTYYANRDALMIILREFEQPTLDHDDKIFQDLIEGSRIVADFVRRAQNKGLVGAKVDPDIVAGTLIDRLLNQARYAHTHKRLLTTEMISNRVGAGASPGSDRSN